MKNLFEMLDDFFLQRDFTSKKRLWYKLIDDSFIIFEFQPFRFDYGKSGFLNFGIIFKSVHDTKIRVPKGEKYWDLRGRSKNYKEPNWPNYLVKINLKTEEEVLEIHDMMGIIDQEILPFLTKYANIETLKNDIKSNTFDYMKAVTSIQHK